MLTYLEHVGLVSIFEKEIANAQAEYKTHKANSELKNQADAYRSNEAAAAREFEVRIRALRWSLEQVNRIKHEYS